MISWQESKATWVMDDKHTPESEACQHSHTSSVCLLLFRYQVCPFVYRLWCLGVFDGLIVVACLVRAFSPYLSLKQVQSCDIFRSRLLYFRCCLWWWLPLWQRFVHQVNSAYYWSVPDLFCLWKRRSAGFKYREYQMYHYSLTLTPLASAATHYRRGVPS